MKKKIFIFSVLLSISLVAIFLVYKFVFMPSEPLIGGRDGLPRYEGERITNIGKDKILSEIPKEFLEQKKSELESLLNNVVKNPKSSEDWLKIGLIKKFFNNYTGARDAWEYAVLIDPTNPLNYSNLANLYAYYLNDIDKGEDYYRKAIQRGILFVNYYVALADFYRDFYKDEPEKEENILRQASELFANDINLLARISEFYKRQGNIQKAIEYIQQALKVEPKNDTLKEIIQQLHSEL